MAKRDFLTLLDFSPEELKQLVSRATDFRNNRTAAGLSLTGKTAVLIFQLQSTRTRVAFEAGFAQLGGHAVVLSPDDSQLGRGEPIADTARVLSEMVDVVIIRTPDQQLLEEFAASAVIPVIHFLFEAPHDYGVKRSKLGLLTNL